MPNQSGKKIDSTYLTLDIAEERFLQHRDYLAHCLRWSRAAKLAGKLRGDLWVLDVGCGREMPLAKLLYSNRIGANRYCGADYNRFPVPGMLCGNGVFPIRLLQGMDAANLSVKDVFEHRITYDGPGLTEVVHPPKLKVPGITFEPNLVTMFEVFEHVEPEHGRRMLEAIHRVMRRDGTFLFSTPCFNGNPAANHVAEPEYEVMGATLEDAGFAVDGVWGTFASISDYRDALYREYGDDGFRMYENLKEYYDVNLLAVVFAPLFPQRSRNCLWQLSKVEWWEDLNRRPYVRRFSARTEVQPTYSPTGSSSLDDDVLDWALYEQMFGTAAAVRAFDSQVQGEKKYYEIKLRAEWAAKLLLDGENAKNPEPLPGTCSVPPPEGAEEI